MATRRTDNAGQESVDMGKINALTESAKTASQTGDFPTAISSFEQLLQIDPVNAVIMSNLGILYFNTGNKERAVAMFASACDHAPENEDFRRKYRSALCGAASESAVGGNFRQAITWLRTVLAEDPQHPGARIDLANALEASGFRAELADFTLETTTDQLGTHLLIACMPKSGSTFLKETLCMLTGWTETLLSYAYLQNEQELYLPYLLRVASENTVTQQHCRATGPNTQMLQAFGIRPVVLVRRLDDIVLSLSDFYDSGATLNTFFGDVWPSLDQPAKYDLIIDHVMPWYVGFYASWERAQRLRRLECLFVTYEDMVADKPAMIGRISEFLDLGKSSEECTAAVAAIDGDAEKTRFNKGVAGRGAATLSGDQIARLRRLASPYGSVNLERIGLAE